MNVANAKIQSSLLSNEVLWFPILSITWFCIKVLDGLIYVFMLMVFLPICDWICRWKLVEINADLPTLTFETKHVMSLINPANTYMVANFILWASVVYICAGYVSCWYLYSYCFFFMFD